MDRIKYIEQIVSGMKQVLENPEKLVVPVSIDIF
jgi:hypothetical protein